MDAKKQKFDVLYSAFEIKEWVVKNMSSYAWGQLINEVNVELTFDGHVPIKTISRNTFWNDMQVNVIQRKIKDVFGLEIPFKSVCKCAKLVEKNSYGKEFQIRSFLSFLF